GFELGAIELVWVADVQIRAGRLQIEGRVRNVDRVVVRGDVALVWRIRVEDSTPRVGSWFDDVGSPHEKVGAPAMGHTIVNTLIGVVRLILQAGIDVGVVGQQIDVDRRGRATCQQPTGRVARGVHTVV